MDAKDLFEILVREHADSLTVYLRSVVRDPGLADDLFQETMITAWRNLDRYDRTRPLGPWLRGIAAKLVLASRRKTAKAMLLCDEETLSHLDHRLDQWSKEPGDTFEERLAAMRACMETLPDRYRDAVLKRYHHPWTLEELAAQLNLSLENLKKRLQRARARLLECIERKIAAEEAGR